MVYYALTWIEGKSAVVTRFKGSSGVLECRFTTITPEALGDSWQGNLGTQKCEKFDRLGAPPPRRPMR